MNASQDPDGGEAGEPEATCAEPRRNWFWAALPLALLLIIAIVAVLSGLHRHLSIEQFVVHRAVLASYVESHRFATVAVFAALYIAAVALSVPGALVLTIIAGFLFGPLLGGAIAALSATSGATLLFLVARGSLGEALRQRAGRRVQGFAEGFRRDAFHYLLFLRLVPVAPFWLVNLAPAFLGVQTRVFVTATALGILPATFAFAILGAGLESVLVAHEVANTGCADEACRAQFSAATLLTPGLVTGLVALGLLALLPVAVKHWRRRRRSTG
jgi:uncharacterized membrane protein YdjX (TVP38/TMEM64 family)